MADTKKTGTFRGKSNKLGSGGRAAQLKAQGVPGAVIGEIARAKGAAPGGPNYHSGYAKGGRVARSTAMMREDIGLHLPMPGYRESKAAADHGRFPPRRFKGGQD